MSTIPSAVKEILTATGYNSALSILQIDENKLTAIEKYADENSRDVIDSFKEYSNKKPFAFLPGHRECIFGIKSEILNVQSNKKSKIQANSSIDVEFIRSALYDQLTNFTNANPSLADLDIPTAIQNITTSNTGSTCQAVCLFECSICGSAIRVPYNHHWKSSNLLRHLRMHIDGNKAQSQKKNAQKKRKIQNQSVDQGLAEDWEQGDMELDTENNKQCDEHGNTYETILVRIESSNQNIDFDNQVDLDGAYDQN